MARLQIPTRTASDMSLLASLDAPAPLAASLFAPSSEATGPPDSGTKIAKGNVASSLACEISGSTTASVRSCSTETAGSSEQDLASTTASSGPANLREWLLTVGWQPLAYVEAWALAEGLFGQLRAGLLVLTHPDGSWCTHAVFDDGYTAQLVSPQCQMVWEMRPFSPGLLDEDWSEMVGGV